MIVLAGDLGAGKTAFVQGFGRASACRIASPAPPSRLVHVYEGRLPVHHLDVYRLEQLSEALDLGLPEMLDEGGVVLVEWGDAILPVLPHDFLEVRLTFGAGDDDRHVAFRPVGHGVGAAPDALAGVLSPGGWRLMLILGITTSTAQVGCAIGGHEGVLGAIHSTRAAATPRPSPRPSSSCAARAASSWATSAPSPSTSGPGCSPGSASASPPARRCPTPAGSR